MRENLNSLHDAILEAASELERLVNAAVPDSARLAQVRFTIAKSSNARSRLLESTIYPTLLEHLGGADADKVQRQRDQRLQGLVKTAEHIAEWGTQRIADQWPDYRREASSRVSGVRSSVRAEQEILLPLIEKLGRMRPGSERLDERSAVL